jgi:phage gpG-like protein
MAEFSDMLTAAQLTAAVDTMRFDVSITSFEFKPSLGIMAKALTALGNDFQDMRVPLKRGVEDVMTISILENFMSGGRPSWDALSETTMMHRQADGSGSMILVRSGALANAASSVDIWSIGRFSATIRDLPNNVWYGKVHQAGMSGNAFAGGKWFKKYQDAARKTLGSESSPKEVDNLAFKMFDTRATKHGPAPSGRAEVPARPFAIFQDEDIDAIQLIFIEWMEEKLQMRGLA